MKRVILLFVLLLVGCATRNDDLHSDTKIQVFLQTSDYIEQGVQNIIEMSKNAVSHQNDLQKNVKKGSIEVKYLTKTAYNLKVGNFEAKNGTLQNGGFAENAAFLENNKQYIDYEYVAGDKSGTLALKQNLDSKNHYSHINLSDEYFGEIALDESAHQKDVSVKNSVAETDIIDDIVFYLFDENGVQCGRESFSSADQCILDIPRDGRYTIYALCNVSRLTELPEKTTVSEIERLTIPHTDVYDRLPFAGKGVANVTAGCGSDVVIKLNRLNSLIKFENKNPEKVHLDKISVTGLPSRGLLFGGGEADGVEYNVTSEAVLDENGDYCVYSFYMPENRLSAVGIDADAEIIDGVVGSVTKTSVLSKAPFGESLETGMRATAYVGYLDNGSLKVGSADDWGNTGGYILDGDVTVKIVGGMFTDDGELRSHGGGDVFSYSIETKAGKGQLVNDQSAGWVTVTDETITVSKNDTGVERRARIAVRFGTTDFGAFNIVQGKGITFSGKDGVTIDNGYVRVVGGTGSSSKRIVEYDADAIEMEDIVIATHGAVSDNKNGISIDINRADGTITATFVETVDAALMNMDGVEVPVTFTDSNGEERARIVFAQRPVEISFSPQRLPAVSSAEGDAEATVTTEDNHTWILNGDIVDADGSPVSWVTKTSPALTGNSGDKLVLHFTENSSGAVRTAYIRVKSGNTLSKVLEVSQQP